MHIINTKIEFRDTKPENVKDLWLHWGVTQPEDDISWKIPSKFSASNDTMINGDSLDTLIDNESFSKL